MRNLLIFASLLLISCLQIFFSTASCENALLLRGINDSRFQSGRNYFDMSTLKNIPVICECGKTFLTRQSRIDMGFAKHCSRKCFYQYHKLKKVVIDKVQVPNGVSVKEYLGYHVFSNGTVIGKFGRRIKPSLKKTGYLSVALHNKKTTKHISLHRLLAILFIKNPENKREINHIDCNKQNNDLSNLEWCSRSENTIHAHKNGLISIRRDIVGKLHRTSKPVVKLDVNKNPVGFFDCIREASESIGVCAPNISFAIKNKTKSGGFYWNYKS